MTDIQISGLIKQYVALVNVTKATWNQNAARNCLMAVTRKIMKDAGINMPEDVRNELIQAWEFKGLACNASQLRQWLFIEKGEKPEANGADPYAKDLD